MVSVEVYVLFELVWSLKAYKACSRTKTVSVLHEIRESGRNSRSQDRQNLFRLRRVSTLVGVMLFGRPKITRQIISFQC